MVGAESVELTEGEELPLPLLTPVLVPPPPPPPAVPVGAQGVRLVEKDATPADLVGFGGEPLMERDTLGEAESERDLLSLLVLLTVPVPPPIPALTEGLREREEEKEGREDTEGEGMGEGVGAPPVPLPCPLLEGLGNPVEVRDAALGEKVAYSGLPVPPNTPPPPPPPLAVAAPSPEGEPLTEEDTLEVRVKEGLGDPCWGVLLAT